MNDALIQRLDALKTSLEKREDCLGLLALGSCADQARLDEYSDLDFFVLVEEGKQEAYLNNLDWLSDCGPLAFVFRNSIDGHKIMWQDGIYAEYAIFEASRMPDIAFTPGKFLFKKEGLDVSSHPIKPLPNHHQSIDYALNEILTNLYVGLSRYHRGEKLAAFRLIQVHAIDRLLAMIDEIETPKTNNEDAFALDRRIEQRHPGLSEFFSQSMQGYDHSVEVAQYILSYLHTLTILNTKMTSEIIRLIKLKK